MIILPGAGQPVIILFILSLSSDQLLNNYIILTNFDYFFRKKIRVSGSHNTLIPGVTKITFLLTKCPLLFTHWLGQCTIALLQKNQQIGPVIASSNKEHQSQFCDSQTGKKGRKFSVFALGPLGGGLCNSFVPNLYVYHAGEPE